MYKHILLVGDNLAYTEGFGATLRYFTGCGYVTTTNIGTTLEEIEKNPPDAVVIYDRVKSSVKDWVRLGVDMPYAQQSAMAVSRHIRTRRGSWGVTVPVVVIYLDDIFPEPVKSLDTRELIFSHRSDVEKDVRQVMEFLEELLS